MSNIDKQVLREAAEKATALNLDTAQVKRGNDGYLECPCCEGAGYVEEEADFCNIDGVALGVQFYGIGEHHGLAEAYFRAANPATVLALLDELEASEKLNAELMEKQRLIDICQGQGLEHRIAAEKRAEAAEKRIAELEATQGKPVMFIDGDISPADADKLAAVIREFNEETETPAARMARIIRENPHPTNMCDMPAAAAGKGEAS
ncbi:ead/Ea22-like family protein [Enterobacter asburiae]|uniref:ead/Ea22-like family protein n=1 Tax=Enterobacter asburiae TaxID=61645 RepID=UPI0029351F1B|nr:ead/Ea22-like family protein [Enterobacter asburiae]